MEESDIHRGTISQEGNLSVHVLSCSAFDCVTILHAGAYVCLYLVSVLNGRYYILRTPLTESRVGYSHTFLTIAKTSTLSLVVSPFLWYVG